uniref:Uncharacterized protein n=1 Tax=Nelumbo nucifera TaxID=4432 RepID=A0A822ZJA3_NELNU|nr:TPA_asm: hypothetical protein HUJ06_002850 [Nelumbo nucifera]
MEESKLGPTSVADVLDIRHRWVNRVGERKMEESCEDNGI